MPPFARAGLFCLGFLLLVSAPHAEDSSKTVKPQPLMCGSGLFDSRRQEDAAKNISGIDCRKGAADTWSCVAVADEEIAITEFSLSRDEDGNIACEPGASFKPERFGCLPGQPRQRPRFRRRHADGGRPYRGDVAGIEPRQGQAHEMGALP